jgi:hypothetical protein
MRTKSTGALLALVLWGAGAWAQEPAEEKPSRPRKAETPLRLQVVFSRYQGERKIASFPYVIPVNAEGRPGRLRMGINVPLKYEGKETPGNVVFKSVGNNVDCSAESLEGGRYRLACSVEQSSLHTAEVGRSVDPPVLRTFNFDGALILRDGETGQYTSATDPITGETLKVDMTLTVVR